MGGHTGEGKASELGEDPAMGEERGGSERNREVQGKSLEATGPRAILPRLREVK